jgi:hypothetical protein
MICAYDPERQYFSMCVPTNVCGSPHDMLLCFALVYTKLSYLWCERLYFACAQRFNYRIVFHPSCIGPRGQKLNSV